MSDPRLLIQYGLDAKLNGSVLELVSHTTTVDQARTVIARKLVDLEQEAVRRALIRLGWTPPPKKLVDPEVDVGPGSSAVDDPRCFIGEPAGQYRMPF